MYMTHTFSLQDTPQASWALDHRQHFGTMLGGYRKAKSPTKAQK